MNTPRQATAIGPANIAFIKYWGVQDAEQTLPTNGSISMCLDACVAETTVRFDDSLDQDQVFLALSGGEPQRSAGRARERVVAQLDRVRAIAGTELRAEVTSRNTFPSDAGIASSAAAFSALTVAAAAALGLELSERELSILTRRSGSGSACRSIPHGFVEWVNDGTSEGSYAVSLAPAEHWDLRDIVAVVDAGTKRVASEAGHKLAFSSPYFQTRLAEIPRRLEQVRQAIVDRNMALLAEASEADAVSMHCVAMTATPPAFYWGPGTMAVIHAVRQLREDGLPCCYTIDAGANVHVLCERAQSDTIEQALLALPEVQRTIVNGPGKGARVI